jgi:hypothetical protein
MFGSIALDVFIGLVLIYLLYSLLVTIIGEMIATWLGIRARLLRKAIEKMLNDNPEVSKTPSGSAKKIEYFFRWLLTNLGHFFLYQFKNFENSLAGKFYEHPSIKYLAQSAKNSVSFKNGKPAYISKENFSDTLVQMFRNKGNGATDMEKINFCLKYNTLQIEPETIAHIRNLVADSENDLNKFREKLMKWFEDTMDRTNGWYKRKLSLITFWLGFLVAVAFNVDSIKLAQQLSHDKDARNQLVQIGISQIKEGSVAESNTKRISDSTKADTLLRKSFDEVYKATESANKILGLGWNFEALRKTTTLSRTFYPYTFAYVNKEILDPLRKLYALREQFSISANASKIVAKKKFYLEKINETNTFIDGYLRRLNFIILANISEIDSVKNKADSTNKTISVQLFGKKKFSPLRKVGYIIRRSMPWHVSFWGFVLTALALSLGAPFWFDLLKKLIALRGAGVKPEEKADILKTKDNGNTKPPSDPLKVLTATAKASVPEEPIVTALRIYKDIIESEKGVVKVAQGYLKVGKKVEKCVQVNVIDQDSAIMIRAKYSELRIGDAEKDFVPANVLVTGKPILLSNGSNTGIAEKGICNSYQFPKGMGTFSCLVRDRFEKGKTYLMTCYHVVNRDNNWNGIPSRSEVVDFNGKHLSSGYRGYLTPHLDTALIKISEEMASFYKSIANARYPKGVRDITTNDVLSTEVFINGFASKEASGTIIHESWPDKFTYGAEMRKFEDLIKICHIKPDGTFKAISQIGDSGSLVLDKDNYAVGIVFAGNFVETYALKMTTILGELGLELIL